MKFFHIPPFFQKLFPQLCWRIPTNKEEIYLTFDDGPTGELTEWIEETLHTYNAKATFFCVGENLRRHPDWMMEVRKKGHTVANHTYNHLNGWKTSTDKYIANVSKCEEITGNKIFRPPYGLFKLKQIRSLIQQGFRVIMWDVMPYDFDASLDPEIAFKKIIKYTKPGSIIVFHDNLKAEKCLKYILPRTLEHFSKLGYNFPAIQ